MIKPPPIPFDLTGRCVKCGTLGAKAQHGERVYWNRNQYGNQVMIRDGEDVMLRTCMNCEHKWVTAALDASHATEAHAL